MPLARRAMSLAGSEHSLARPDTSLAERKHPLAEREQSLAGREHSLAEPAKEQFAPQNHKKSLQNLIYSKKSDDFRFLRQMKLKKINLFCRSKKRALIDCFKIILIFPEKTRSFLVMNGEW